MGEPRTHGYINHSIYWYIIKGKNKNQKNPNLKCAQMGAWLNNNSISTSGIYEAINKDDNLLLFWKC